MKPVIFDSMKDLNDYTPKVVSIMWSVFVRLR